MDFKELRDKILPNIEYYNKEEVKIVVAKLLEFLIENDEKRQELEKEINELKSKKEENNKKVNEVNIDEINKEKEKLIAEAKKEAQEAYDEIIQSAINKMNSFIDRVKQKDEANKMYRKHILSIFRKSLFRFSNTNYYILKTDDKEFQELIKFFQVDEELQKLCDENIKKLMQDEYYQQTVNNVENKEIDIFNEEDETEVEIKDIDISINESEEIPVDKIEDEVISDSSQKKTKFLDVLNQYKNK